MRTAGLCVIATALVACSFHASYDDTRYRCGASDTCPAGQRCIVGVCTPGAGLADAPPAPTLDASPVAGPDAAVGARVCGSLTLLADDFADGVPGPSWAAFSDGAPTTDEVGGSLVVQVPAGGLTDGAGYRSVDAYDFTGGQLAASVGQVGGVTTSIDVIGKDGTRAAMRVSAGMLYAIVDDGASPSARAQVAYDPAVHKRWRVREAQGDTYWEWSTDGAAWTGLWREPTPFPVDHVTAQLGASGERPDPGEAHFDDVNLDAAAALGYCASATLRDDFASGSLAPTWRTWTGGPCVTIEAGGQVTIGFPGTGDDYCGIEATTRYDAIGSSLYVDAGGVSAAASFESFFQLVAPGDGGTRVEFDRAASQLQLRVFGNGEMTAQRSITYDATAHRYWRFTADATTVRWETSPDATTWTERSSLASPFDLSAVHVVLGAGTYAPGPGVQTQTSYRGVGVP